MKKIFIIFMTIITMKVSALELPTLPTIPTPGNGEIFFIVRNVTNTLSVNISEYWTNRDIKRKPIKTVKSQSIFVTSGTKWLSTFVSVLIKGKNYSGTYSMGAISGYDNFADVTYFNAKKGTIYKDYSSVEDFVTETKVIPNHQFIDETPEYFVNLETFKSGSGDVILMCISDKKTFHSCQTQN